ncbi:DUF3299 domain-containing protein [Rhodopirellula sp. JC740]|uniref:DUF3299 domain-containing protein n=1 Tax=Rhodopirellula halodulae TaxID=2894198 RepID=A0ABS8NMP8_9BACT|nr:DUF3299 domain-containing protein [Rhodopirellula sp. JC740]MCC9644869.1 DUF3299 domain-containing protein [Rhodopirellula sp. JC740]
MKTQLPTTRAAIAWMLMLGSAGGAFSTLVVSADEASQETTQEERTATARSIIEQRRAAMRGDANGREKVEIRKSSPADLAKGDITFDDLTFEIQKGEVFDKEKLTKEIKFLDGRNVRLRGYMLPSTLYKETDIDQFVLVRDNQECCFGPGAALFDCVMIEMQPGRTTDFVPRPVTVEGKFVLDTKTYRYPGGKGPDGASHSAIFRIEGLRVR